MHTIKNLAKKISTYVAVLNNKFRNKIALVVILWLGDIRMRIAIKAAHNRHADLSFDYSDNDVNSKHIRQYIVLLDKAVMVGRGQNRRVERRERLFFINRKNFKAIRRRGWLPKNMMLDALRHNAFYFTDMKRNYQQEENNKNMARKRYANYLTKKYKAQ
jgi:hypothetical protein